MDSEAADLRSVRSQIDSAAATHRSGEESLESV